jgi:hypothetical protein
MKVFLKIEEDGKIKKRLGIETGNWTQNPKLGNPKLSPAHQAPF